MSQTAERIEAVRARIAAAARRSGRAPERVRLVGITKTHPPDLVAQALAAGLAEFGENRVQEAEAKIGALAAERAGIRWHLIGHLQSNKARRAAALFDVVQSVDSLKLAETLDRVRGEMAAGGPAADNQRPSSQQPTADRLDILLQVNVSGEATKEGFRLVGWDRDDGQLAVFLDDVERIIALPNLRVRGLMTVAPWGDDPEAARPTFRSTARLRDELAQRFAGADWSELSMGMSDDFEIAIAEGATIVRVGRALFGERATR